MDIREAMKALIDSDELVQAAGLTEVNRRFIKWKLVNNDPSLRDDTMKKWLLKAGFMEKSSWSAPKAGKKKMPPVDTGGID